MFLIRNEQICIETTGCLCTVALHCTDLYIITLSLSRYYLNNVEWDVNHHYQLLDVWETVYTLI